MSDENELNLNERRFVAEYVAERNATQAYIRAFTTNDYTPTYLTASKEGSILVRKPRIAQEIEAAAKEHARKCGISARRVLRGLALIAFADPIDLYEDDPISGLPKPKRWSTVPASARKAIASIKVKKRQIRTNSEYIEEVEEVEYRMADRAKALSDLCEHLGLKKGGNALEKLLELLGGTPAGDQSGTTTPGTAGSEGTAGE